MRKGCGGLTKIVILLRFWTSDVHEMLRLSRFVALLRHHPRLKIEIERRARERKEERERRSADVKARGSRSADVKV